MCVCNENECPKKCRNRSEHAKFLVFSSRRTSEVLKYRPKLRYSASTYTYTLPWSLLFNKAVGIKEKCVCVVYPSMSQLKRWCLTSMSWTPSFRGFCSFSYRNIDNMMLCSHTHKHSRSKASAQRNDVQRCIILLCQWLATRNECPLLTTPGKETHQHPSTDMNLETRTCSIAVHEECNTVTMVTASSCPQVI